MRSPKLVTSAVAAAAVAVGGVGITLAPHASAAGETATFVGEAPNRAISFSPGGTSRPMFAGLDKDGDKVADTVAYCIEPKVTIASGVYSGSKVMSKYDLSQYSLASAGKVRWVVQHGFPATSPEVAAQLLGVNISGANPDRVAMALQAATQAAIWKYTSNYSVPASFKYDTRTVAEAGTISLLFQKAYQYLVVKAVWVEGSVTVWDSKPGDAASQGLVEVPVPDPTKDPKCGCDDWVKTR